MPALSFCHSFRGNNMMVKAKMTREQIHVSRLGEVNGIGVNIKKRIAIKWKVKAGWRVRRVKLAIRPSIKAEVCGN